MSSFINTDQNLSKAAQQLKLSTIKTKKNAKREITSRTNRKSNSQRREKPSLDDLQQTTSQLDPEHRHHSSGYSYQTV